MSYARRIETIVQRLFTEELKARREAGGLSRVRLAESLGCTRQWLDKVETLERTPSGGLADDLDTYFKTGGTYRRLWEALREVRKLVLVPTGFLPIIDIEKESNRIRVYEPMLIPGLFQTEEYARTAFAVAHEPPQVEEQVAIRMARQEIMDKSSPPWIFLLLRESALRDVPAHLLPEQCKRLLDVSERLRVSVQLLPMGAPVFVGGAFQITSTEAADVVFADAANGCGQTIQDPEKVATFALNFEQIRSSALSAEETRSLIRRIMEDA
ncbi:helix-turn-helix transcriptional regulator [Actinocorallia aurea]